MELRIRFQILKSVSYYNEAEIDACHTDRTDTDVTLCSGLSELLDYEDIKYRYPIGAVSSMGAVSNLGWLPAAGFEYDSSQDYRTGDWETTHMAISPFCEVPEGITQGQNNRVNAWIDSWVNWLLKYDTWDIGEDDEYNLTENSAPAQVLTYNENQLELSL